MSLHGTLPYNRRLPVSNGALIALRSLGKPTPAYPAAIATDAQLAIAVDRLQTRLAVALNASDLQMTVVDPTGIVADCLLSIDNEIVQVTTPPSGNTVSITRGFDGTTPAVHLASALVSGFVDAWHHNTLVSEIQAIETALGPNLSNVSDPSFVSTADYDFPPQSPGGNLVVGVNSIVLAPVPKGVNGSDQHHYLYIDQGTGTPEAVLIVGGSAVAGVPSGTVFVNCANTHSGAWRIRSASAGIQEAIVDLGDDGGQVNVRPGVSEIYALTYIDRHIRIAGSGVDATVINNNSPSTGVFQFQLLDNYPDRFQAAGLAHVTISAGGATNRSILGSNSTAVLINGNGDSGQGTDIGDLIIKNHNVSLDIQGGFGIFVHEFNFLWQRTYGLRLNGSDLIIANGVISNSHGADLPANPAGAGFIWEAGGGIFASQVDIAAMPSAVVLVPIATSGGIFAGFFTSFLADTSNSHGITLNSTDGVIYDIQFVNCWSSYSGAYSAASLPAPVDAVQVSITVTPSISQPYPIGGGVLTINDENITYTNYAPATGIFSGLTRGAFGTTPAAHTAGSLVFVAGAPASGFRTLGANAIDGISIVGGMYVSNAGDGIHIGAGNDIQIGGGALVAANSQYATRLANGIVFDPGVSNWAVRDAVIGNVASVQRNLQNYGISIGAGAGDGFQITDNLFRLNAAAPLLDASTGTHKIITKNTGIDDQPPPTIASAATISLGTGGAAIFSITGTTAVGTLSGGWIGRRVRFIKTDAGSVSIGPGFNIPGTHTLAQNGALDLTFDGNNWF